MIQCRQHPFLLTSLGDSSRDMIRVRDDKHTTNDDLVSSFAKLKFRWWSDCQWLCDLILGMMVEFSIFIPFGLVIPFPLKFAYFFFQRFEFYCTVCSFSILLAIPFWNFLLVFYLEFQSRIPCSFAGCSKDCQLADLETWTGSFRIFTYDAEKTSSNES